MDLAAQIAALHRRIDGLAARATVLAVDDTQPQQRTQVGLVGAEVRDQVEHFQPYGFTAVPKAGAEALVIFVGGRRQHPIVMPVNDRRRRLRGLQPGEVAIYTDEGDYLIIRRGGSIEIKGATGVTVTSPNVKFTGSVEIDGDVDIKGNALVEGGSGIVVSHGDVAAGTIQLKTHHHTGVQAGGSITGPPV